MDKTHHVYLELNYQMRKREDLRSEEEITLIALQEWMARNYGQPTAYQAPLYLRFGGRLSF